MEKKPFCYTLTYLPRIELKDKSKPIPYPNVIILQVDSRCYTQYNLLDYDIIALQKKSRVSQNISYFIIIQQI